MVATATDRAICLARDDPIAAGAFRAQEGSVGAIDERVNRLIRASGVRNADRDADDRHRWT